MMTEMEINPEVLSRWRQEVSDLSTGVERINDSVYVFYSTEADLLAVRVLGDRTIHLYDITNTLLPDTMTANPWPLWASQWRDVGRLLDAGDVEGAKHLAEKLVILELSEGTVEEEEEEVMAIKDDRPDNLDDDEPRRVILHDTKVFEREDETTSMDRTPRRSPRMASRESSRVSQGLREDDPAVPGSRAYLAKKAREAAARLAEQPEQREREARQREAENIAHQDQEDVQ